jgi:hypothetical protein
MILTAAIIIIIIIISTSISIIVPGAVFSSLFRIAGEGWLRHQPERMRCGCRRIIFLTELAAIRRLIELGLDASKAAKPSPSNRRRNLETPP